MLGQNKIDSCVSASPLRSGALLLRRKMGRKRSDIADDGYVWHKYGSKNVRGRMVGYFKCTHVGCGSRKKVWRQANGAEVVERDGTHAHVAPGGRYEYVGEVSMHADEEDEVPVPVNVAARGGAGRATGILEGGLDTSVRRGAGDLARAEGQTAQSKTPQTTRQQESDDFIKDLRRVEDVICRVHAWHEAFTFSTKVVSPGPSFEYTEELRKALGKTEHAGEMFLEKIKQATDIIQREGDRGSLVPTLALEGQTRSP